MELVLGLVLGLVLALAAAVVVVLAWEQEWAQALERAWEQEPQRLDLELEAAIDPLGRSLRPDQVAHWLAEAVAFPLSVDAVRRQRLCLKPC